MKLNAIKLPASMVSLFSPKPKTIINNQTDTVSLSYQTQNHQNEWKTPVSQALAKLYPQADKSSLLTQIDQKINHWRSEIPEAVMQQDRARPTDWYKDAIIYRFYADFFGPQHNGSKGFDGAAKMLPYLKKLGVTTLYALPFMNSPQADGGFDISDFTSVREDLGGLPAFQRFASQAKAMGFTLVSDMVLNHVSEQHPWFQAALAGDPDKKDWFVSQATAPQYKVEELPDRKILHYTHDDGTISSRKLIFADNLKNHYRKESIQGKNRWFFHTFFPFQVDLNWQNSDVMLAMLDVVGFWAKQGIDVFRLDATSYMLKPNGHSGEGHPLNQEIVQLLNSYLKAIRPGASILAELDASSSETLNQYFQGNKVQMTYPFPLTASLWASLVKQDSRHFWEEWQKTPAIPDQASWVNFLRSHDELALGYYLSPEVGNTVREQLNPLGMSFRAGQDVAGRLYNLLGKDPKRAALAMRILLTLPGTPDVYYGDEVAAGNNPQHLRAQALRRQLQGNTTYTSPEDTRDLNRGPLSPAVIQHARMNPLSPEGKVFRQTQQAIVWRKENASLRRGRLQPLKNLHNESLLGYQLEDPVSHHQTVVIHNLSEKSQLLPRLPGLTSKRLNPFESILVNKP